MPLHDLIIDNQPFPATRADINAALLALGTLFSSATAPTTPYAYQLWADTTTNTLKIRSGANNTWITIGNLDQVNLGLAALASPTFTGLPQCPTAASGTNTQQIASCAMVQSAISRADGFVNPTLLNSWTSDTVSGGTIQYRKRGTGKVELRGIGVRTSHPSGDTILFNLPAGFRPNVDLRFPANRLYTPDNSLIIITSAGAVTCTMFAVASSTVYFNLSTISFSADA